MQLPYEMNRNDPLITTLESAIKKNGITPIVKGSEGATVMTFFQKYKIPAISFGVGPDMAHQTDEYVEINALVKGAEVIFDFVKMF
ncbi:putative metallohydrolase [uncultured archaeon]|nr:putative metallohydrolase [uncultured archaeon]